MRETLLEKTGADRLTIRTDDRGTLVLDAAGQVLEEHGNDRHEEALDRYRAEGWRYAADDAVRTAGVGGRDGGTPGLAEGGGPAATVTDGEEA